MKIINTDGINFIEEIPGSDGWYWGTDYANGDLYEAEEVYKDNKSIRSNRLIFVHYPDGTSIEPFVAQEGQYFGQPTFENGKLQVLMVDFPKEKIFVYEYDHNLKTKNLRVEIPLSEVKDCYNLILEKYPLMLTRQGTDDIFQIIWPEKAEFSIDDKETFYLRDKDRLYFNRWTEEPVYKEEVIVRKYPTGEIIEVLDGALKLMKDGELWILR